MDGPVATFDNYLPGPNVEVWQTLQDRFGAIRRPFDQPPIMTIWGVSGSGKTHLLQSVAALLHDQGLRAGAFSSETPLPWTFDESWSAILLDDCDDYDAAQQHAAFALYIEAATHGVAVLAALGVPPVDVTVREDLRTRLGWGEVYHLNVLSDTEVRAVLRLRASVRGLQFSEEVLDYLLSRFDRQLGALTQLLDRLDDYALAHHRPTLTIPLIKQMLTDPSS